MNTHGLFVQTDESTQGMWIMLSSKSARTHPGHSRIPFAEWSTIFHNIILCRQDKPPEKHDETPQCKRLYPLPVLAGGTRMIINM